MNKKLSIIIMIIVLLLGIVLFFLVKNNHKDKDKEQKNNNYSLVLNNYSVWEYNKAWYKSNIDRVNNKTMSVYIDKAVLGDYTLVYGSTWNLFDANKNYVNYEGDLVAISPNKKLYFINYKKESLDNSDLSTIRELSGIDYLSIQKISPFEKVVCDLDNNGVEDSIIIASNKDIQNQIRYFNIAYVNLNGQVNTLLNKEISADKKKAEPSYSLNNVLLFEKDTYGSIVLHKTYFSESGKPGSLMFGFDGKKYQLLIED